MPGIQVQLRAKELLLPLSYQYALQGVIYQLLQDTPEASALLHDQGYDYGNRRYKLFTFSRLKGRKRIVERSVLFEGPCRLEIRSPHSALIDQLLSALQRRTELELMNQNLPIIDFSVTSREIDAASIRIRMLSPLTVHRNEGNFVHYFAPDEPAFPQLINENYRRKHSAFTGVPTEDAVLILPSLVTAHDRCVTRFKGTSICSYYGEYILQGTPEALTFLYDCGLGARNSQGFGMFECDLL